MRLAPDTVPGLGLSIERFAYNREFQGIGIVHFGLGAFHRAHQAWYTDLAMSAGARDWMIVGVSLRSSTVMAQLNPQDGLYTVTCRSGTDANTRVVGAVRKVLVASRHELQVLDAIASPECRIVSFTVTEKGYCRKADGSLDADLAADGFYPIVAKAFARRRDAGLPGLSLLCCDNLADNGKQLARLMHEYLDANAPDLSGWFDAECTCPSTMVDRIVPATTDIDLDRVCRALNGIEDNGAVFTEPFSQWVIEDRFANGRPAWENVGAQVVTDVAPYETAKLRILNGAHSALAYLGLSKGYTYVHEAIDDPGILALVERLMREEAAPTIAAAQGQDLATYSDALVARFSNPALQHRLAQIAMDGSQKIPQRWLATLAARKEQGLEDCPAIFVALGAWLRHIRGDNGPVDDPLAREFADIWANIGKTGIVDALLGNGGLLPSDWSPSTEARRAIEDAIANGHFAR